MTVKAKYVDIGLKDYKEVWDYQEELLAQSVEDKKNGKVPVNTLIFCEHPHVFTLGRSGNQSNMLITSQVLEKVNASFYKINRGGDITYHGPGQLVGYPIFDLEQFNMGIKQYIYTLEEAIIKTLMQYGIATTRFDTATGVWTVTDNPRDSRKICAIGVKVSKYVTMHGFALNVNTDLNYFSYINPCGFIDKGVTSMQNETGKEVDMENVKNLLKQNIYEAFSILQHAK